MPRTVTVRVLAIHAACDACGSTARIVPDCDRYAEWAAGHVLPVLVSAEVLIDGVYSVRPVRAA